MKKVFIICIIALTLIFSSVTSYGGTSDKQLAINWANNHGGGYTIEKVITVSKGGTKGKKVTVYMVEKNGDVYAMVCLGKVK